MSLHIVDLSVCEVNCLLCESRLNEYNTTHIYTHHTYTHSHTHHTHTYTPHSLTHRHTPHTHMHISTCTYVDWTPQL